MKDLMRKKLGKVDKVGVSCCLLAFLLYLNTLDADFVYDDSRAILRNQDVLSSTPFADLWRNDFWGTPLNSSGSHGSYRPLCVLSFRLNHWACGFKPGAFHLVNVLIHVLNSALVLRVARLLLPPSAASSAALLFAAHPIHTEAVTGIVGRADLLACMFFLLSFVSYLCHVNLRDRHVKSKIKTFTSKTKMKCCQDQVTEGKCVLADYVCGIFRLIMDPVQCVRYSSTDIRTWGSLLLCISFAVAATLSKETGITVLLVCAAYDVIRSARIWPGTVPLSVSLGSLGAGLLGMCLLRLYLMGLHTPSFASADNPTAHSPYLLTRIYTFFYLPLFNLQLLLWPRWLSFDWSMDAIPRVTHFSDSRNLLSVVFYFFIFKAVTKALIKIREQVDSACVKSATNQGKVKIRSCSVCKYLSGDHHSAQCRVSNNNNQVSKCECVKQPIRTVLTIPNVYRTTSEIVLVCFAFLIFPFLPATNILFYVGFVVAERVLYLPSVGFCFLVAFGFHLLTKRSNRRLMKVVFVFLLVIFGGRTIKRNIDWKNEENLYRSGIPINPPKAFGNLGSVLNSQGRLEEAERAYNMALQYRPNMADVHYNLGVLLQGRGQYEEAIKSYHNAIQCRPSLALAHLKLGELLASRGRCEEAERVFRRCAQLDVAGLKDPRLHEETKMAALIHLGRLHADRGRHVEAVNVYKEAVDMMPPHYEPEVLYNLLGESLVRVGEFTDAERWFKAALDSKPDHAPAHLTYGKHLARNKTRILEAEQWFLKAQRLAPSDPSVYQQYGQLLTVQERFVEAAHQFVRAVQLSPRNYDLVLGAATALREAGRYSQAETYYRRAVSLRPQDSTSHSNLGAMLHLSGKLTEAEASYKEALRIDPRDVTTLTNVHKLRHLMARIET